MVKAVGPFPRPRRRGQSLEGVDKALVEWPRPWGSGLSCGGVEKGREG